jgi:hypothetical protein
MRRITLALVLMGAGAVSGCYGGNKASSSSTNSGTQKGATGQYYFVNLFTPPVGGIITSDVGGITCGASSVSVNTAVNPPQYAYAFYGSGAALSDRCGQTRFEWAQTVTLTATGQGGNAFLGWAGDCNGTGTCTLANGADKAVVAIFGEAGGGHGNFTDPGVHGPAYFGFLSGTSALQCTTCHGPTLAGQGIAPSCNACHAGAGWTSWQTNCSFCHGAKNTTTQAGYAFLAHPAWAAPPDAISQRLTGTPALDRTGAHQAHLNGVTPSGLSVAPPFTCATCHAVPADLSHVSGSAAHASVLLSGAGQASLPASLGTYNQLTGTCATYCHGPSGSPAWSATHLQCNGCHGVPPASPHPYTGTDLTACAGCHGNSMNADGSLKVGGLHLDGLIQATGGHGDFTSPAVHGPAFFDSMGGVPGALTCSGCHGATYGGGTGPSCNACHIGAGWTGWNTNCSFCHGAKNASTQPGYPVASHPTWSAPPDAIAQRLDPAHATVPARTGAHEAHLTGVTAAGASFAPAFSCQTCHAVPGDLSHIGGSTSRATVALTGAGQAFLPASLGTYSPASGTCATYCHGTGPSPVWATTGVVCGSCHALPPSTASGHPNVSANLANCSVCHPSSVNADGSILSGGTHLDGSIDSSGGHGDYSSPATHGPRFFDYLAGLGSLDCKACHGATYDGGIGPSCNACHASAGWTGWQTNCSFCHGGKDSSTRTGYSVAAHPTWSAPPDAIAQRLTGVAAPSRTGAHQAHLTGTTAGGLSFATPFACATCHAVPSDLSHIGGSTSRATVALAGAGQASLPPSLGTYSQPSGTCATYCHGTAASPAWATTGLVCGSCHALPPTTGSGHPSVTGGLTACSVCHPDTMNPDGSLNVAGGKHLNGVVDGSGHGDFTSPATHGPAFFDFLGGTSTMDCKVCHGADYGGGVGPSCNACHASNGWTASWQTNCSFCHGTKNSFTQATAYAVSAYPLLSAPPDAIAQRLDPAHAAVAARTGAHVAHLTGRGGTSGSVYSAPIACGNCHAVPGNLSHIGGSSSRATVALVGTGSLPANLGTYSQAASTCTTYCHGSTLVDDVGHVSAAPAWWPGSELGCAGCHGYPPNSGQHNMHVNGNGNWCTDCHAGTVFFDNTIVGTGHLNGLRDVQFYSPGSTFDGNNCTALCHEPFFSNPVSWR